ncbi:hypothetical protein COO60DRAFT_463350 [Scenedesmus sp. NREL 46B-D3]|nr:hypothetical protein COO60DRAFT_463350 [Scenedesmus sp. NREL 46B-D3]
MDLLLRRSCACPRAQSSSSRHPGQTPPNMSCVWRPSQQLQLNSSNSFRGTLCIAAAGNVQATPVLKSGMQGQVDTAYLAAANYLKTIGFTNTAEMARVLDIAMNPNSMFVQYNDAKRSTNVNARPLTVEEDMQPVVGFFVEQGLSTQQIVQVITAHPPVLSYSVPARLQPFWEYMASIGVPDVAAAVARRPSLLGLDVDANLRKIVDYLQYVETPPEKIVQYITTTI